MRDVYAKFNKRRKLKKKRKWVLDALEYLDNHVLHMRRWGGGKDLKGGSLDIVT